MRLLIVDDEPPARGRLRRLLATHVGIEVVGEAGDGESALAAVERLAPDALLLDVQMPGTNGLDVAVSLPRPGPAVVFVTAHDTFALQAFDAAALDYLLKPVAPDRLARAIERLRARTGSSPSRAPTPPSRLLIPDRGRTHVVAVADIAWLEAADNYVVVHAAGRAPLMRRTLAGLLEDLGAGFVRVHRGAAVAVAQVVAVEPRDSGDAVALLRDGSRVPCSRAHRAALAARLAAR